MYTILFCYAAYILRPPPPQSLVIQVLISSHCVIFADFWRSLRSKIKILQCSRRKLKPDYPVIGGSVDTCFITKKSCKNVYYPSIKVNFWVISHFKLVGHKYNGTYIGPTGGQSRVLTEVGNTGT